MAVFCPMPGTYCFSMASQSTCTTVQAAQHTEMSTVEATKGVNTNNDNSHWHTPSRTGTHATRCHSLRASASALRLE